MLFITVYGLISGLVPLAVGLNAIVFLIIFTKERENDVNFI